MSVKPFITIRKTRMMGKGTVIQTTIPETLTPWKVVKKQIAQVSMAESQIYQAKKVPCAI